MNLPLSHLKPGDLIQTSLLRYRILWAIPGCVRGVLVAVRWGEGWREPLTLQTEEEIHVGAGNWQRTPKKEIAQDALV